MDKIGSNDLLTTKYVDSGDEIKANVTGISVQQALLKKEKLGVYAMKRVAAGAHLLTVWLFGPAKSPDDRADYCLDYDQS